MNIQSINSVSFEKWRWDTSDTRGIGGSETTATELGWRLATRGHQVTNYVPLPDENLVGMIHRGVFWKDLADVDLSAPGLWLVFRNAEWVEKMPGPEGGQRIWLLCQDEAPLGITAERVAKLERVVAYCPWHKAHMERYTPEVRGKVCVSTNGIKVDLIREVEAAGKPERNPRRLMFASSPDRGLLNVLKIFKRAREYVPDLELYCCYGINNIEKLIDFHPRFKHYQGFVRKLKAALDQPGVHWLGRISQRQLYQEWLKTGIFCSCTNFCETSGISSLESMALGAIPLVIPKGAFIDNIRHGVFIEGDEHDPLVHARFVDALVRMAECPEAQEAMRPEMMQYARQRFNWSRVCDQLEAWMLNIDHLPHHHQFAFQRKYLRKPALNIGCNCDGGRLKDELGAVNVDISEKDPFTGIPNKADVLCDARQLPYDWNGQYGSVVLGDILEHMGDEDQLATLRAARRVLRHDGRVIITCPDDARPAAQQHHGADGSEEYCPGVRGTHFRHIARQDLERLCQKAGFRPTAYQQLDYANFLGHGIVAEVCAIPKEETAECS